MSQINNNIDPDSRDYDLKSIEPDERFTQTTKEFWITLGTYLVFMVLMIANLYLVGGKDVSNPLSSNNERNKNSTTMIGRKLSTLPTPLKIPSITSE